MLPLSKPEIVRTLTDTTFSYESDWDEDHPEPVLKLARRLYGPNVFKLTPSIANKLPRDTWLYGLNGQGWEQIPHASTKSTKLRNLNAYRFKIIGSPTNLSGTSIEQKMKSPQYGAYFATSYDKGAYGSGTGNEEMFVFLG